MKKYISLTFILLILFVNSKVESALDITVKNREGKPAVANVQIFPGEISPDSDKEPVPPPTPRADGLVGFKTSADGKVRVEVQPGEYTVVAFSQMDEHRFSLVKRAVAPGSVELSAAEASAVTIFAVDDEGAPLAGANIFFRPSQRVRGFAGSIDNDGYLEAYVSPGDYHVILISSLDRYYLVLPYQKVNLPGTRINIEAANLPTVKVDFDLPPFASAAIYEVLETELTYEKIEAIEEAIGYDATYTNEFVIIPGIATLSANLTYWFNIEFVDTSRESIYAYEIRPSPILLKDGAYHIGSAGDEKFDVEVTFDKPEYHPGETVTVSYKFLYNRKNRLTGHQAFAYVLHRLFDYSGARLIFPFVTVRNPDGVQIASNPHTEDFFGFSFNLPPSAGVGKYSLQIYLDAQLYGKITRTTFFNVVAPPDEKPKISRITVPKEAEAGSEIIFSADIEDDKVIEDVTLTLSHEDGRIESFQNPVNQRKISFRTEIPDEFVMPGKLNWEILAKDATGNETAQSGQVLIRDTTAPIIEHKPIETVEIGVDIILEAQITDNAYVSDARLSYRFNDGNLQTVKFERSGLQYRATIPAVKQFGVVSYFIQSDDGAGNVAYFPAGEDARLSGKFVTAQVVDTTPPLIYHSLSATPQASLTKRHLIEAVVDDNNAVAEVKLYYKSPDAGKFIESAFVFNGNVYQATILESDFPSGVEYFIEAFDKPDQNGSSRRARAPVAGAYLIQPPDAPPPEIELLPPSSPESPIEIEAGTNQPFTIQDRAGNPVQMEAIWTSTGSIGCIDQTGLFTALRRIRGDGYGKIIATLTQLDKTNKPLQATAYVKLKPGKPSRIALAPQFARMSAGKSQYFHAVLMDDFDNEISNSSLQWSVSGNIGEIDQGVFTAKKVGTGLVEARFGNLKAVSEAQVDMGKIARIEIAPKDAKIRAGEKREFTALGYDAMGNSLPIAPIWTVQGGVGKIENGMFTGGKAGNGEVIAILGNLQASATVTVSPGELNSIDVVPFIDYLTLSTKRKKHQRQFAVFGWDAGGNPVSIKNLRWETDAAAGRIDKTGLFTSTDTLSTTPIGAVVTNGSVFAFGQSDSGRQFFDKSVVVIQRYQPESPERIGIYVENFGVELDKITMSVGERERLEVTGFDKHGRRMSAAGGVASWEVLGDIGFVTPDGVFTATRPGVGEIVATDGGFTAKITVEMTPSTLKSLVIKPEVLTLNAGDAYQLTAYGYDEFGNSSSYDELQWFIQGDVASVTEGKITAKRPGAALILAESGGAKGYAQLFVLPGKLHNLKIEVKRGTPARLEGQNSGQLLIAPGERVQFIAKGFDSAGNELTVMPNWHVSGGVGEIAFDGSFIATRAGKGEVRACVGNVCATKEFFVEFFVESIQHSACPLRQDLAQRGCVQRSISPNPLNIIAKTSQQFVALGLENPSWHVIGNIGLIDEQSGFFTAGGEPGTGYVVATSGVDIATANVSVYEESKISELFIIPQEKQLNLRLGEGQKFRSLALTDDKRLLWVLPVFNVANNLGYIDAMGNFTAQRVGEGNVIATLGSLQASCPVNVTSGVPTQAEIISGYPGRFELKLTDDAKKEIIPQEVIWLLPDKLPLTTRHSPLITYRYEYIEPQLATLSEPFYELTAIAKVPLDVGKSKTVIASNFYTSSGKPSPSVLNVLPSAVRARASDAVRIVAICSDSNGNLIPSTPTWTLKGISNLGTISDNGLFIGNRAGKGAITASLLDHPFAQSIDVPLEVIPNRPVFATLQPDTVIFPPKNRTVRRFEFLAFDARNNPVEVPAEQIQWKLIGEIGQVDNAGNFTPITANDEERGGFLTAFIPERNLFARAQIRLLARQNAVKRIRIEPAKIDLIRGKTHRFRAILLDYKGNLLPPDTLRIEWAVLRDNGEELKDSMTSEGVLKSTNANIGEQLRVLAYSGTLSAEAFVNIVAGPLDTIKVTNLSEDRRLKVGEMIELSASGLDAYGNGVDVRPKWWATSGKVIPKSNNHASYVATEPGNVTILAEQDGIVGKTEISAVTYEEVEIKITALSADENAGQTLDNPIQVEAGSTILLTARNREEIINSPDWTISPPAGVISENGRFSAEKVGNYKITATFANRSADFFVEVKEGKLASIQVKPPVVSILTKEKQQFSAKGFDAFGNELPEQKFRWDVTGGIGTIDESGSFSPTKTPVGASVYGTVVATPLCEGAPSRTAGLPSGSASVTVVSKLGPPVSVTLKAEPLVVQAGGESELSIFGADEDGNPIASLQDYSIEFSLSPEVGRIITSTDGWVYNAPEKLPTVKDITLRVEIVSSGGSPPNSGKRLTSQVTLSLVPAQLAELSVEPKSVTLSAGEKQRFQLSAFDIFSNPISLKEAAWRLSKSLGELSDRQPDSVTYIAQKAGNEELIAGGDNHTTTTAAIQITPSSTVKLSVEPPSAIITAGDEREFVVIGFDAYDNKIENLNALWRIEGDQIGNLQAVPDKPASKRLLASKSGESLLIVQYDEPETRKTLTAQAAVKVTPGKLKHLLIQLAGEQKKTPLKLISGGEYIFKAEALDEFGNELFPKIAWKLTGNIGLLKNIDDVGMSQNSFSALNCPGSETPVRLEGWKEVEHRIKPLTSFRAAGLLEGGEGKEKSGVYPFALRPSTFSGERAINGRIAVAEECSSESQCIKLIATFVGEGSLIATASDQSAEVAVEVTPLSEKVGREGGLIESPAGASIFIPKDALKNETEISIAIIKPLSAITDTQRISDVIDFQPRGLVFKKPVKLTLSYESSKIERMGGEKPNLSLYFWDAFQEKWVRSGGKAENQRVTAYVNHLAPFAIMESQETPQTAKPLDILYVELIPEVFYAPENNRLTIEYSLAMNHAGDAEVTIKIYDFLGGLVATPINAQPRDAGDHAEQWDGTDENGKYVQNGRYVLVVIAKTDDDTVTKKKLLVVFK